MLTVWSPACGSGCMRCSAPRHVMSLAQDSVTEASCAPLRNMYATRLCASASAAALGGTFAASSACAQTGRAASFAISCCTERRRSVLSEASAEPVHRAQVQGRVGWRKGQLEAPVGAHHQSMSLSCRAGAEYGIG